MVLLRICLLYTSYLGIEQALVGNRIGDIGAAIQEYAESRGYGVVRDLVGHGVGPTMHEEPMVPNYGVAGRGLRLKEGMVLTIEPMINTGTWEIDTDPVSYTHLKWTNLSGLLPAKI